MTIFCGKMMFNNNQIGRVFCGFFEMLNLGGEWIDQYANQKIDAQKWETWKV